MSFYFFFHFTVRSTNGQHFFISFRRGHDLISLQLEFLFRSFYREPEKTTIFNFKLFIKIIKFRDKKRFHEKFQFPDVKDKKRSCLLLL